MRRSSCPRNLSIPLATLALFGGMACSAGSPPFAVTQRVPCIPGEVVLGQHFCSYHIAGPLDFDAFVGADKDEAARRFITTGQGELPAEVTAWTYGGGYEVSFEAALDSGHEKYRLKLMEDSLDDLLEIRLYQSGDLIRSTGPAAAYRAGERWAVDLGFEVDPSAPASLELQWDTREGTSSVKLDV